MASAQQIEQGKPDELVRRFVRANYRSREGLTRGVFDRWIDMADANFASRLRFPAAAYRLELEEEWLLLEAERVAAGIFAHVPGLKRKFRAHPESVHLAILARRFQRRFGRASSFQQDKVHYLDLREGLDAYVAASRRRKSLDMSLFAEKPLYEFFMILLQICPEFPAKVPQRLVMDATRLMAILNIEPAHIKHAARFADALKTTRNPSWFYAQEKDRIAAFADSVARNEDESFCALLLTAEARWKSWKNAEKARFLKDYGKKFASFFGSNPSIRIVLRPRATGYAARHCILREHPYDSRIEIPTKSTEGRFHDDFWEFMVDYHHELAHDIQGLRVMNARPASWQVMPLRYIFMFETAYYHDLGEGRKRYARQPVERHAYWFGPRMTEALKKAAQTCRRHRARLERAALRGNPAPKNC